MEWINTSTEIERIRKLKIESRKICFIFITHFSIPIFIFSLTLLLWLIMFFFVLLRVCCFFDPASQHIAMYTYVCMYLRFGHIRLFRVANFVLFLLLCSQILFFFAVQCSFPLVVLRCCCRAIEALTPHRSDNVENYFVFPKPPKILQFMHDNNLEY